MTDQPAVAAPKQSRLTVNGVGLALYERAGAGRPILFAHANGFHARCWDQVIARLPGRRVYAVDLRGHGASDKPPPPGPYAWRRFGEDLAALGRALGLRGALAVGHSIGGHAAALAAALAPDLFAALLLLEPVILPPAEYGHGEPEAAQVAARRRDRWASPDEMFARFKDRPPFDRWDPATLRDYCDHGLTPAPDGDGFVLACPPAIEAAIYAGTRDPATDIHAEIARVAAPVRVVRAARPQPPGAFDMAASFTAPDLAQRFRRGEDVHLPQCSHLLATEAPALVAEHVRALAG